MSGGDVEGRVRVLVRSGELLEGRVRELGEQPLLGFLADHGRKLELVDAVGPDGQPREELLQLIPDDILWAAPVDPAPGAGPLPPPGDHRTLRGELVLQGGEVLVGNVRLPAGRTLEEHLSAAGAFVPVEGAHSKSAGAVIPSLVVRTAAITRARAKSSADPAPGAATGRAHRLIVAARRWGFPGAEDARSGPESSIATVWKELETVGKIGATELASQLAHRLRLSMAPLPLPKIGVGSPELRALEERYSVRIVAQDARALQVATADPLDVEAEQALGFTAGRSVEFQVATPRALGLDGVGHGPLNASSSDELGRILGALPDPEEETVRVEDQDEPEDIEVGEAIAAPIVQLADAVLREAVRLGASDIHLEPADQRGVVRMRVDGVLRPHMHIPLTALNRLVSRYKIMARLDIADRVRPQDGQVRVRVEGERFELRISTVPTQDSEKAVIRIAGSTQEQTLDEIGLPDLELERLRHLLTNRDGILVVTGPTGSGKTTTLYAALRELNTGDLNIVTIEDPVERTLPGATQIQVQPRRGVTFASALRAVMRQDPDVILVGEIRDEETAELAIRAAMTGHFVLTTLHTTTAVGAVARLRDLGLDPTALAATLRGIVAQRLARRTCGDCAGGGCPRCEGKGLRGRIPVTEVLTVDAPFADLVGRGRLPSELHASATGSGMRTMREVARHLVERGLTTAPEILRVLGSAEENPEELEQIRGDVPGAGSGTGIVEAPVAAPDPVVGAGDLDLPLELERFPSFDPAADGDVLLEQEAPTARSDSAGPELERTSSGAERPGMSIEACLASASDQAAVFRCASEELARLFDAPYVWAAGVEEDGSFCVLAHAGVGADPEGRDGGVVGTRFRVSDAGDPLMAADRTGGPVTGSIEELGELAAIRSLAGASGLEGFVAVPIPAGNGRAGMAGVHLPDVPGPGAAMPAGLELFLRAVADAVRRVSELHAVRIQLGAFESMADAVFIADRTGRIQWANPAFSEMTGWSADEVIGRSTQFLRSDRHPAAFYEELRNTVVSGKSWRGEIYNRKKDGTVHPVEQTITPVLGEGGPVSFIAVLRDISSRKEREEALLRLVASDADTGLPNWRGLIVELEGRVSEARKGRRASLLLARISRERSGGVDGEPAKSLLAEALRRSIREGEFLAKLGDDEFAVVVPGLDRPGAVQRAESIATLLREALREGEAVAGATVHPSRSGVVVGIAEIDGSTGPRGVLAAADAEVHHLSASGSGEGGADQSLQGWGRRIREAIQQDLFFLHFQPVVRLSSGEVEGYSALLRLFEEDGTIVPARIFIGHAEDAGLISELDQWVVNQAIHLLAESPELELAIHLSPDTLLDDRFRTLLKRQHVQIDPVSSRLSFEVAVPEDPGEVIRLAGPMTELAGMGYRFVLDGVGFDAGSITALGALPAYAIKIDASLVQGLDRDPGRREIARAIAQLAHALGREVVASGAESVGEVEALPELGIDLAEGHQIGRPGAAPGQARATGKVKGFSGPSRPAEGVRAFATG